MTTNAHRSPVAATPVAFIGGTGRSGSTLLSRVLGSVPGVCSVGELCWLWSYGVTNNRVCGCGAPFHDCPFWTHVGKGAYGGWDNLDAARATDLRRKLTRNSRIPSLWTGGRGGVAGDLHEYTDLLSRLYSAIRDVSGSQLVVDNSKQATAALIARQVPGTQLKLIHLVRRSHGVVHSWTKSVARTDMGGREMRRRAPARTAVRWTVDNALLEALGGRRTPRILVRYEDFVAGARTETERILRFLGVPAEPGVLAFIGPDWVELGVDHSVWGNPMRLRTGREPLRRDDSWRRGLTAPARRLVTVLSLPALARYGYLGSRQA